MDVYSSSTEGIEGSTFVKLCSEVVHLPLQVYVHPDQPADGDHTRGQQEEAEHRQARRAEPRNAAPPGWEHTGL